MSEIQESSLRRNLIVTALVAVLMGGFVLAYQALTPAQAQPMMGDMASADGPQVPPVTGYAEGQQILFLHTEASQADIAELLTEMMGSPVPVVPELAAAPESMLAKVYVFKNGIQGRGPLGYQPDVFASTPASPGYSPLRRIHFVVWKDAAAARELRSAAEVLEAEARNELTIEQSEVVVNMPLLTWPGGQR